MKYRYTGPTSSVTLNVDGQTQEVILHAGTDVELPDGHEYTQTLIALGYLSPVKQADKAQKGA